MKITLIGPVYPYRGGIAHYTTVLERYMRKEKKYKTQLISFRRQYPHCLYPGDTDRDPSTVPLYTDALYLLDPLSPLTWIKTVHAIRAWQPDCIIFQWWSTFWVFPFSIIIHLLGKYKKNVVYLVHNVLPHEQTAMDTLLTKIAFSPVRKFLVQTKREAAKLKKIIPRADQIVISPHPVYNLFADKKITKEKARALLGISQTAKVLLFFGFVRKYKGLEYLLDALASLQKMKLVYHLLIVGEFWGDKNEYTDKIRNNGLSQQVTMIDRYVPNEEVSLYFSASDIFVAPYVGGSQSGALKLAQGFGLPIIATTLLADERLLTKKNVVFVEPRNVGQLAEAIAHDPTSRTQKQSGTEDWNHLIAGLISLVKK